jgi:hypothetical protein
VLRLLGVVVLFLDPRSWAFCFWVLGPRSCALVASCELRARRFGGVSCLRGKGVRALSEDILLSDGRDRRVGRGNSRASYGKRSEYKQGREIAYKKVRILAKMLRNRAS